MGVVFDDCGGAIRARRSSDAGGPGFSSRFDCARKRTIRGFSAPSTYVLTIVVITDIVEGMIRSAKVRQPGSPEETAFLDLLRTADMLTRSAIGVLKGEDLSHTQYNVLRILRGSPQGLPCGEIAGR